MNYKIGDCREVLKEYPDDSFDSCVTDAPYELDFMGKGWDRSGIAYDEKVWSELFRVLKPGAFLLSFGGTRTYHRMACAVEDAGFEIRDMIPWIYGSGFPKSLDISKSIDRQEGAEREVIGKRECGYQVDIARRRKDEGYRPGLTKSTKEYDVTAPATPQAEEWNGWGTALKPAIEPIVVARKPLSEKNIASNVLKWGTGGINVDASRIATNPEINDMLRKTSRKVRETPTWEEGSGFKNENNELTGVRAEGRFPANLILECICEEVIPGKIVGNGHVPKLGKAASQSIYGDYNYVEKDERYLKEQSIIHTNPNCPCYLLDEQSGEIKGDKNTFRTTPVGFGQGWVYGEGSTSNRLRGGFGDSGGASRFFYIAKASRKERYFFCSVCQRAYPGDQRDSHRKHMMHCEDCDVDYEPTTQFQDKSGLGKFPKEDPLHEVCNTYLQGDHKSHSTKSNLLFHVTQKPERLIRYLIKLVTPKGGTVLDPFLGSGTTLVAAHREGFESLGIELGAEYEPLIKARTSALPRRLDEF